MKPCLYQRPYSLVQVFSRVSLLLKFGGTVISLFSVSIRNFFLLTMAVAAVSTASAMGYILFFQGIELFDIFRYFSAILQNPSAPALFIGAMILLPPLGFPISFFLALAGIRFGIMGGMILTFFILPVHMTICFMMARTFFRGPLTRFLTRRGYKIPMLQTRRPGLAMFGFLLMPGPPYALKTYLLAMTKIPYPRFLFFNWFTETLITLPIVAMAGAATEKNWFLFAVALFIFALSLGLRWYEKRKNKEKNSC